jgi:tetratricopeptide (TPR) repeat protein
MKAAGSSKVADLVVELWNPTLGFVEGKPRPKATAILRYRPAAGDKEVQTEPYDFEAPLGPLETEELAWYLERYSSWPTHPFQERARQVEGALPQWGQLLYRSIRSEAGLSTFSAWEAVREAERRLSIFVKSDPSCGILEQQVKHEHEAAARLLSLPWELIHNGKCYLFQHADGVLVRRCFPCLNRGDLLISTPIRVLLISPRPKDKPYIDHRISVRPVVQALLRLGNVTQFRLLTPPTFPALQEELGRAQENNQPYHVVHFDGHGIFDQEYQQGVIYFEEPESSDGPEGGLTTPVLADELACELGAYQIPMVFLEACQTSMSDKDPTASVAGRLLKSGIRSVVAMSHIVLVETTRRFVEKFYRELMRSKSVGQAMLAGQRYLKRDARRAKTFRGDLRLQDWFVPMLFQEEQDLRLVEKFPAGRLKAQSKDLNVSLGEIPAEPEHLFVGRSRELRRAERLLEQNRYVVIRGAGGEGKTTLAAELARWVVLTRRFQRAAFISFEQYRDAHSVLFALGSQLVTDYVIRPRVDQSTELNFVAQKLCDRPTVIVLDNMESVLPPLPGSEVVAAFEPETLKDILEMCNRLSSTGHTALVFTSREPLPEPFAESDVIITRLDSWDAIALVGNVLRKKGLIPGDRDQDLELQPIEDLVGAAGCHARSLALLARELAERGIKDATENFHEIMTELQKRYADDRERSLFASVELSLRRLPTGIRSTMRPFAAFQGGASLRAIGRALRCTPPTAEYVAREICRVGLGELSMPGYLRLDPALGPMLASTLTKEELQTARESWAEALVEEARSLWAEWFRNQESASRLISFELSDIMASLGYFSRTRPVDRVVDFAADVENLIFLLDNPKQLAMVVRIRNEATAKLPWCHVRFRAEAGAVDRLLEKGWHDEAKQAARAALERAETAGDTAYEGARSDIARLRFVLARSLLLSGDALHALPYFEAAHAHYLIQKDDYGAEVSLARIGACLAVLGRSREAGEQCKRVIESARRRGDARAEAVGRGHLAGVLAREEKFSAAIYNYKRARNAFEKLGEWSSVAKVWHAMGLVYRDARDYKQAEWSLAESLKIRLRLMDKFGENCTLADLTSVANIKNALDCGERFTTPLQVSHAADPRLDI